MTKKVFERKIISFDEYGNKKYLLFKKKIIYVNVIQYSDAQAILIQEPNGWNQWDWIGTNISIINNTIQYNGLYHFE